MASNWGSGYKRRQQMKRNGVRMCRQTIDQSHDSYFVEETRAELIGFANEMVEQFDEQYTKLFQPDDRVVDQGGGIPIQMRPGRLVQWQETCGLERKLWRICAKRLHDVDPFEADAASKLFAIWTGAVAKADEIPTRKSEEVKRVAALKREAKDQSRVGKKGRKVSLTRRTRKSN